MEPHERMPPDVAAMFDAAHRQVQAMGRAPTAGEVGDALWAAALARCNGDEVDAAELYELFIDNLDAEIAIE